MKVTPLLAMVKSIAVKLRLTLTALISFILATNSALADFEQRTNKNIVSLGVGAKISSAPYSGQDPYTDPIPLINIEYGRFFFKGATAGFHFYNHKRVSLALAASYRSEFLDVDDINKKNEQLYYGCL